MAAGADGAGVGADGAGAHRTVGFCLAPPDALTLAEVIPDALAAGAAAGAGAGAGAAGGSGGAAPGAGGLARWFARNLWAERGAGGAGDGGAGAAAAASAAGGAGGDRGEREGKDAGGDGDGESDGENEDEGEGEGGYAQIVDCFERSLVRRPHGPPACARSEGKSARACVRRCQVAQLCASNRTQPLTLAIALAPSHYFTGRRRRDHLRAGAGRAQRRRVGARARSETAYTPRTANSAH